MGDYETVSGAVVSLKQFDSAVARAAEAVSNGGVIIYPTDTLYGLGANALSEKAVKRVFELKQRENKPISICLADAESVKKFCVVEKQAGALLEKLLPGPFTFILKAREAFPHMVAPEGNVGVRVPASDFCASLCRTAGVPVTATSANLSGEQPPFSFSEVNPKLAEKVDVLVDGGETELRQQSTVIDLSKGKPVVLRKGAGIEMLSTL